MVRRGDIYHEGVIVDVNKAFIMVEILNKSDCSSCHAKAVCSMGSEDAKIVEVENRGFANYEPGERVNVKMKQSIGFKAVWISYTIPLFVLILGLFLSSYLGASDLVSGLVAIGAVVGYYAIMWLIRDKFRKTFIFTVEKL